MCALLSAIHGNQNLGADMLVVSRIPLLSASPFTLQPLANKMSEEGPFAKHWSSEVDRERKQKCHGNNMRVALFKTTKMGGSSLDHALQAATKCNGGKRCGGATNMRKAECTYWQNQVTQLETLPQVLRSSSTSPLIITLVREPIDRAFSEIWWRLAFPKYAENTRKKLQDSGESEFDLSSQDWGRLARSENKYYLKLFCHNETECSSWVEEVGLSRQRVEEAYAEVLRRMKAEIDIVVPTDMMREGLVLIADRMALPLWPFDVPAEKVVSGKPSADEMLAKMPPEIVDEMHSESQDASALVAEARVRLRDQLRSVPDASEKLKLLTELNACSADEGVTADEAYNVSVPWTWGTW